MGESITRLLIVEDERITAEDLRISLKNLGYEVVGAVATGQDAIASAQKTHPDLVLMDIILKGSMSGIEATMRIQSELDIPVVYLTAFSDESTIMRLRESKPFGYLQKPFDDKELAGVIETALEKFRIQKALRESREWFSVTLQSLGDAVICTNMDARISFINPTAEMLTGWSEEDALDRPLSEVLRIVNEETDRPLEDPATQVLKLGQAAGLTGRTLLISKDGQRIPIDDSAAPIRNARGETIGVVLVFKDVTERRTAETALRNSEEKYRLLVDNVNEAIYVAQDGRIQYANPMTATLSGYSIEELDSLDMTVLIHPEDRDRIMKHHDLKMRGKKTQGKDNCRILMKSGEVRWVEFGYVRIEWQGRPATLNFLSDITDRKIAELASRKAEEALRISEEKYRMLVRYSSEPIFSFNPDETYHYVNEAFAKPFGKKPEDIIGKTPFDIFSKEEAEKRLATVRRVFKTGVKEDLEVRVAAKTGETLYFLTVVDPIKDLNGNVAIVSCSSKNITDRKLAEEALRLSEQHYRVLAEASPEMIYLIDREGMVQYVNGTAASMFGKEPDAIVGLPIRDLFPAKLVERHLQAIDRVIRTGETLSSEVLETFPTGQRWIEARLAPVKNDGIVTGVLGLSQDISERKTAEQHLRENEEKFRIAFDNAPTGMSMIQPDGKYIRVNPLLCGMFGYTEEELLSGTLNDITHPDDVERGNRWIRKMIAGDTSEPEFEKRYIHKDGHVVWGLVRAQWIRDEDGSPRLSIAHVLDITDRKRADEALRESEEKFRKIFEDHAAVKLLIDPNSGSIVDANNAAADYYGWSREELKRMKIGQINTLPPEAIQKEMVNAKSLKRIQFEFQHRRKDGSIREVEVYSSSIHVGDKELLHSIIHDITERKRMEESLRESESDQRTFAEKLTMLMATANEISLSPTLDDLSRNAVELGRERLGYDRVALYFMEDDGKTVMGTFGTDERGNTRDERNVRLPILNDESIHIWKEHIPFLILENHDLYDHTHAVVGRGTIAAFNLWDGQRVIGNLYVDNLMNQRPIAENDQKILNLYATMLGHLCTLKRVEESLRQSETEQRVLAERLVLITDLSNELSSAQSFDDLCRKAVEYTRGKLGFDRASLWFIDQDQQNMTGSFGTDDQGQTRDERSVVLSPIHERIIKATQKGESPIKLFDDGVFDDKGTRIADGTLAISNLWNGERAIGVLCVDNKFNGRPFTETDKKTLTIYAAVLGHLCTLKRAESQNHHLNEVLKAIRDVNQLITHERDPRLLLQGTCDILQQTRNYELAVIMTTEPGSEEIHPSAWAGIDLDRQSFQSVKQNGTELSRGPSASAIRTGETTLFRDVQRDPSTEPWHDALRQLGIHSIISVPIRQQSQVIGALSVASKSLEAFNREETELLEEMASDISFALESIEMELDRHLAEETIRRNEERYRTLVESIIDYTYHVQVRDGAVVSTTHGPGCISVTGFTQEEYLTEPLLWHRMVHDEDKAAVTEQAEAILAAKPVGPIEHRIIHKDDGIRWIRNTPVPRYDEEGRLLSYDGVVLDITEKKRADEALWESVEKISSIFRAAPTGIGVVVNRVITEANERLCEMTGYAREELIGQSARILYPTDEDFEFVGREKYRQIAEKETGTVETHWLTKDGAVIEVLLSSTPMNPSDLSHGVTFTALDISERKLAVEALLESESKFRSIIETSQEWIWALDSSGKHTYCNPAVANILGYHPEEFIGRDAIDLLHEDDQELIKKMLPDCMTHKKGWSNIVLRWKHKNGSFRYLESNSTPILNTKGEITALRGADRDITDRIQADEALRMSERKFRTFIEQAVEGFGLVDEEGRIIEWNYALGQITGLTRDEVLGLNYWDMQYNLIPAEHKTPEQYEQIKAVLQDILKTGRMPMDNPTQEMVIRRSDGKIRQVRHTAFIVKTDKGFRIGSITQDITERKQTEATIQESELRYRTLADSGLALIWTSDVSRNCDYFNKPWLEFTGRALEQELGNGWAEGVHPDDLDRCTRIYNGAFDKRESFSMEYRLRHASGEYRWIVDIGTPRHDSQGRFIGYIGHCLDITDRKLAEKSIVDSELKIRTMLDSSPNSIVITDLKGIIIESNKATLRMHHYANKSELMGMQSLDLISPEDRPKAAQELRAVFEKGFINNLECTLLRKDGKTFAGAISASSVLDSDGQPISFVTIASDISERKTAEEALRLRNQELERFERLTVGRELKMVELKKELASLKKAANKKKNQRRDHQT